MTISRRSWRCLSRRALARISIIVMLGESSMKTGALETSPILRASLVQSSSLPRPLRVWVGGTFAAAARRPPMVAARHLRLGREEPHGDLRARHLEAEEAAGEVVVDRGRAAQVERQRRLTDRRA